MPALVLPADVAAPDDWRWLRFGLMDLVANRLRDGAVATMPSESVVGLLRQRGADAVDPLHDPEFAKIATLRVLPHVRLERNLWSVRLDAFGAQRSLSVEAQADDAIKAARDATDALLRKLGHAPDLAVGMTASPVLDDLLQRSGAAMLADQLDEARVLLGNAPPELQQQPRVQQRMAQIELRTGDYAAVESRLHALLDRLDPKRDSALRARSLVALAAAYVRQDQGAKAGDLYEEAIALRKDAADHEVLGVAYLGRGVVLALASRFDEATAELSRARIELETIGDGLGVAGVDVNLGDFQLMRQRPADALPILRNAAREFGQLGAREGLAHALAQQASAEREMLELDAALATTQRFWPSQAHTNNVRMRWTLTSVRATALADVARLDEAQPLLDRIRVESDPLKDAATRAQAQATAANIAWRHGDGDAAAAFALDALVPALRDATPALYARTLLLRAQALRQGGHIEEAVQATRALRALADADDWHAMIATLGEAEQEWAARQREPALEKFAAAMRVAERFNVPEDLVAVAAPYLDALIEASQLDTARVVGGRIAAWADRDLRAASAQARLYRALGQDDAARKAEEAVTRLAAAQGSTTASGRP
jgi:tetratricopeptide (TPR) repeat protein